MARKVVWTEPAWEDLEAAADFIARDSKNYAATFVQGVKEAAASLAEFAERGQVVPEFGDATIRELLVRPYRLVYKLLDDQIVVLRPRRPWKVMVTSKSPNGLSAMATENSATRGKGS